MVTSAIVAALGTSMLALGHHVRMRAIRSVQVTAARVAADAGLAWAMQALSSQYDDGTLASWALPGGTNVAIPNFEGTFTYTTVEGPSDGYTITSVGNYRGVQRTVEAVMKSKVMVHEYALFGSQSLVLNNLAKIDWYNYESGDESLKIVTNSADSASIVLETNSYINGDVVIGPGGSADDAIENNGGQYTGAVYTQSRTYKPPAVSVPDYLSSSSDAGRIDDNRTISSSGKYSRIDLGNSEKLIIDGNVELYITGNVTMNLQSEIQINEGSSLVLYVDGNVEGKNGSVFNNLTQDARAFKLFGTESCSKITLKNSGDMYAIVYAPTAEVTVHNSATLWGSITSRTCELKAGAAMYYDASLRDYEEPALAKRLELASWREY